MEAARTWCARRMPDADEDQLGALARHRAEPLHRAAGLGPSGMTWLTSASSVSRRAAASQSTSWRSRTTESQSSSKPGGGVSGRRRTGTSTASGSWSRVSRSSRSRSTAPSRPSSKPPTSLTASRRRSAVARSTGRPPSSSWRDRPTAPAPATTAAAPLWWACASRSPSISGSHSRPSGRKATCSPVPCSRATLSARASPHRDSRTTVTRSSKAATPCSTAAVSSTDPRSTATRCQSVKDWACSDATVWWTSGPASCAAITTVTAGEVPSEAGSAGVRADQLADARGRPPRATRSRRRWRRRGRWTRRPCGAGSASAGGCPARRPRASRTAHRRGGAGPRGRPRR